VCGRGEASQPPGGEAGGGGVREDPKLALLGLLESGWRLPWEPSFSADWFDNKASPQQVVVTHLHTRSRPLGFHGEPGPPPRWFQGVYLVNLWSVGDEERRWEMVGEVDRILSGLWGSPVGGFEAVGVSGFRDLDEPGGHPRVYRSQVTVEVDYFG